MKALTIRLPFASLVALGYKPIENRSQPTKFRGRLAIHAGLQLAPPGLRNGVDRLANMGHCPRLNATELPTGVILGTVELVDVVQGLDSVWALPEMPWQWILANPVQFDVPVPATGRLGIWEWDESCGLCGHPVRRHKGYCVQRFRDSSEGCLDCKELQLVPCPARFPKS